MRPALPPSPHTTNVGTIPVSKVKPFILHPGNARSEDEPGRVEYYVGGA